MQGRVWYSLPYLGWVNNAVGGDLRTTLVPVVAGALLLYAAWAILSSLVGRKKTKPSRGAEPRADSGGTEP